MKNLKDYIVNENNFFKNLGIGQTRIENWLKEYNIKNYTINDDLTIDVKGCVDLKGYPEEELPEYIQFRTISDYFKIRNCPKLKSLKGCPQKVYNAFYCYNCENLESLKYCPQRINGYFDCSGCSKLKSLDGGPQYIGAQFNCDKCNNLTSLKGAPQEVGSSFSCSNCSKLESLDGGPQYIGAHFYCKKCNVKFTFYDVAKNINYIKGDILV